MKVAIYPGSFDPVTVGHIDLLERSSRLFDKIIVAVVHNVTKNAVFSLEERQEMIVEATRHLDNIEVECFSGLLINYVKSKGANCIIRGLRTNMDFEYELQMSMMNSRLSPEVETIFVVTRPEYMYVSSSAVKEAALLGGNVHGLVPPNVEERLAEKRRLFLESRR